VNSTLFNNIGTSGLVINDGSNGGGSLIYNSGMPAGTVYRTVQPGIDSSGYWEHFHFMSSPVTSTRFKNVFPINQNLIWGYLYNEISGAWINQNISNYVVPGVGYDMWVYPTLPPQTADFLGTFNPDGVQHTVTYTQSGGQGWNLLGNPYTSAIDWDYGGGAWHSAVNPTVYIFWGSNYYTWNSVTKTGTLPNSYIPAESGFFVALPGPNGNSATITIPWAARIHSNTELYKEAIPNLLHLGITGNNYQDETYILFTPGATAGFDSDYDAYKLWGLPDAPQLYSMIPGAVLSGNVLPSIESNPEVSLGLRVGAETTYTITASGMESFDLSVPIYLDDLRLGVSANLRENPEYSFSAAPGDPQNRFRVRFHSTTGIDAQKAINIFIYAANEQLVLNNAGNYEGNYYVYGINGQLIITLQMLPGKEYINSLPPGMYIVKAVTGNTIISRKVVLL